MRYLIFFLVPAAVFGQSPESDQRLMQTLISEVHELRLAIERSTLLGARTQLAIGQLQLQDAAVVRLSQQYNEVRSAGPAAAKLINQVVANIKQEEQILLSDPAYTNPRAREQLEGAIKREKVDLDRLTAAEQQRSAREAELGAQLQAAQNQAADSRDRIAEMGRALDAAMQQLSKAK